MKKKLYKPYTFTKKNNKLPYPKNILKKALSNLKKAKTKDRSGIQ